MPKFKVKFENTYYKTALIEAEDEFLALFKSQGVDGGVEWEDIELKENFIVTKLLEEDK